jgi:Pin2-interacting protein X1
MAYSTDLAGSKLRAKLGASLNESVSAPTSDFAQRHLQKLGWTEGTGLGKHRTGRVSHVKVQKRQEQVGLGHSSNVGAVTSSAGDTWWKDHLGDTLAKLSKKKRKDVTDEDLFEATGGARFGMRAQRRATGKWARTESGLSEQEEADAKARVEWDGKGPARVLLKNHTSSTSASESSESDKKREKAKKSKKKKKRKETTDGNKKRKSKKAKKRRSESD